MHTKECPGKSEAGKVIPSPQDILVLLNQGRLKAGAHCKDCEAFCAQRPVQYSAKLSDTEQFKYVNSLFEGE